MQCNKCGENDPEKLSLNNLTGNPMIFICTACRGRVHQTGRTNSERKERYEISRREYTELDMDVWIEDARTSRLRIAAKYPRNSVVK